MKRPRFSNKAVTAVQHRTALRMVLTMRQDLSGLSAESLSRSHGLDRREVEALLAEETMRRKMRSA